MPPVSTVMEQPQHLNADQTHTTMLPASRTKRPATIDNIQSSMNVAITTAKKSHYVETPFNRNINVKTVHRAMTTLRRCPMNGFSNEFSEQLQTTTIKYTQHTPIETMARALYKLIDNHPKLTNFMALGIATGIGVKVLRELAGRPILSVAVIGASVHMLDQKFNVSPHILNRIRNASEDKRVKAPSILELLKEEKIGITEVLNQAKNTSKVDELSVGQMDSSEETEKMGQSPLAKENTVNEAREDLLSKQDKIEDESLDNDHHESEQASNTSDRHEDKDKIPFDGQDQPNQILEFREPGTADEHMYFSEGNGIELHDDTSSVSNEDDIREPTENITEGGIDDDESVFIHSDEDFLEGNESEDSQLGIFLNPENNMGYAESFASATNPIDQENELADQTFLYNKLVKEKNPQAAVYTTQFLLHHQLILKTAEDHSNDARDRLFMVSWENKGFEHFANFKKLTKAIFYQWKLHKIRNWRDMRGWMHMNQAYQNNIECGESALWNNDPKRRFVYDPEFVFEDIGTSISKDLLTEANVEMHVWEEQPADVESWRHGVDEGLLDYFSDCEDGQKALNALHEYQDQWYFNEVSRKLAEIPDWARPLHASETSSSQSSGDGGSYTDETSGNASTQRSSPIEGQYQQNFSTTEKLLASLDPRSQWTIRAPPGFEKFIPPQVTGRAPAFNQHSVVVQGTYQQTGVIRHLEQILPRPSGSRLYAQGLEYPQRALHQHGYIPGLGQTYMQGTQQQIHVSPGVTHAPTGYHTSAFNDLRRTFAPLQPLEHEGKIPYRTRPPPGFEHIAQVTNQGGALKRKGREE